MEKIGIVVFVFFLIGVGTALADPGIPKVNEVQGLGVATTVIATGNFNTASSVDIVIAHGPDNLAEVPPLDEGLLYQSVYTEDAQNAEVGFISYDKDLDVSTANKVSGQYNLQAVKQVTYLGVDASSLIANDYLMLDGAGTSYGPIRNLSGCPFSSPTANGPSLCNRIETGSSMNLGIANLNTQMGDRFIMKTTSPGVAVYNTVGVSSYATDLPSSGSVGAYIKGSIMEGRSTAADLYETVTFADSTAMSGSITTFGKGMSYTSVL